MTQPPAAPDSGHTCVVLGIGLRAQAGADALQALWQQAQAGSNPPSTFCAVALLDTKAAHPALARWLHDAAPHAAVIAVAQGDLPAQPVQTHSPRLQALYGTGSVAEAAALAAAGPHAQLLTARVVADDGSATLAVALRQASSLPCCLAAAPRLARAAAPNEGTTA